MNNDLEQFSEERLIELEAAGLIHRSYQSSLKDEEFLSLIRIALTVKQAKPVAQVYQPANVGICAALGPAIRMINVGLPAGTLLYTTPPANSPAIPDGWIKYQEQKPSANEYISFVSRHGEYASGLVGEDEWVEMHDGTSFELAEIYIWLLLPPLPAAPKPESE